MITQDRDHCLLTGMMGIIQEYFALNPESGTLYSQAVCDSQAMTDGKVKTLTIKEFEAVGSTDNQRVLPT